MLDSYYTEAAALTRDICMAIYFLHTHNIAHRDLKVIINNTIRYTW